MGCNKSIAACTVWIWAIYLLLYAVCVMMSKTQGVSIMNQTAGNIRTSQRNYGIDLLRLVAAFYVIVLHTMNQGGIYEATVDYSYQNLFGRLLLIVSYCAVNIFGIISGYVGYREPLKKTSYEGYLPLWLTVVFYGMVFAAFYRFTLPDAVTGQDFLQACFPVTCNQYWYFSAFTLVFFFAPFLNKILCYSSTKELKWLFVLICCLIAPIEFVRSSFAMRNGYSAHWLVLLYLVGGIMKKTGIGSKLSVPAATCGILLLDLCFLFVGVKWLEVYLFGFDINFNFNRTYITPFYLGTAILHVILFAKFRFPKWINKVIAFAAPAAFSVYIVNTNPLFWVYFMEDRFVSWAASSLVGLVTKTLLFSLGFVVAVVFVDFLRQQLFRLLGVKNWARKLSAFFQKDQAV